jgi:hypothetical protein
VNADNHYAIDETRLRHEAGFLCMKKPVDESVKLFFVVLHAKLITTPHDFFD